MILMVVVFGGSFNPPTKAHKEIYHLVEQKVGFNHFIFLPVSNKYQKQNLIDDKYRVKMLELLISELPKAKLSLLEIEDPNYLGTYESLKRFSQDYPDEEIAFIVGSDNLVNFKRWINAKALVEEFKFIVINRNHQNASDIIQKNPLLSQNADNFIILNGFKQSISSSAFRDSLDPYYVTENIYQYIMKNNLY